MPKPNLFIVGAPKCGTTALSEYLREHPNVFMCFPKEPFYFATDFPKHRYVKTEKDYLALFDAATKEHIVIGEASALYMYSRIAISNIKKFNSTAKLIIMLRNPVDLAYSMHSQALYGRQENEADFQKSWEMISQRKKGLCIPKLCLDKKILFYDDIAKLGEQLERILEKFPKEQIMTIFFEDFVNHTQTEYKKVLEFLGLPDDRRKEFQKFNVSKRHSVNWIGNLTQRPPTKLVNIATEIKNLFGLRRLGVLKSIRKINVKNKQRQPLPNNIRKQLISEYHDDIIKLAVLTSRNLDKWLV